MESSDEEPWGSSTESQKGLGSFVQAYRKNGTFANSSKSSKAVQNFVSEDAERVYSRNLGKNPKKKKFEIPELVALEVLILK